MICILKIADGQIDGWLIAQDMHGAWHKAVSIGATELAQELEGMYEQPKAGKRDLVSGYTMLVAD